MTPDRHSAVEVPLSRITDAAPTNDFAALVRRWQGAVHAVACATTGDPQLGEDVAQETFVIAWRSRDRLRDPERVGAWLCGIARNRGLSERSKMARAPVPTAHADEIAADAQLDEDLEDAALERLVWREVERLPQRYREPLVLFHREGESIAEVAALVGETEANVRQRLHRGRELLRAEIHGRMEKVLRKTLPGAAFTAAVMAALPDASAHPLAAKRGISGLAAWTIAAVATLGAAALAWWIAATRDDADAQAEAAAIAASQAGNPVATTETPQRASSVDNGSATVGETASPQDAETVVAAPTMTLVVTDLLGGPIDGARILGEDQRELGRTNDDGELAMPTPRARRYPDPLAVLAEGYAIGYVQPAGAGRITLELAPESTYTGHVVDEAGALVVGARIEHRTRQHDRGEVVTAADGSFAIGQLAPGALHLAISAPGHVRRVAAVAVGPIAAMNGERYVLRRGAAIRGHVEGERPADLEAFVMPKEVGGPWPYDGEVPRVLRAHMVSSGAGGYLATVKVDASGDFVIDGVPRGAWEVTIMSRGNDYADEVTNATVDVGDGDATLTFRLPKLAHYTVFAHDDDGRPLVDTNVQWELDGRDVGRSCLTDAHGRCDAAGEGKIVSARVGGRTIASLSTAIRDGMVLDLEGPRTASTQSIVRGTIVDAAGTPLPGRAVLITVKDPAAPGDWPPMWTVFTDATGGFVATDLPAGDARVMALPATRATGEALRLVEPLLGTDRLTPLAEHTVRVAEGGTETVALRIPARAFEVRGTIVDDEGAPVVGAFVSCGTQAAAISFSRTEPTPIDTAVSDDVGAFTCTGALGSDKHTVSATSASGRTGTVADVEATTSSITVVIEGG